MEATLLGAGLLCLIAAVVGGGLKFAGADVPVLTSVPRQLMLAGLGAIFMLLALLPLHQIEAVVGPDTNATTQSAARTDTGFIYLGMRDASGWVRNKFAYGPIVSVDTVPQNGNEVTIVQPVHLREAVPGAEEPLTMSNDLGILETGTEVRIGTVTKLMPEGYYWAAVKVLER